VNIAVIYFIRLWTTGLASVFKLNIHTLHNILPLKGNNKFYFILLGYNFIPTMLRGVRSSTAVFREL